MSTFPFATVEQLEAYWKPLNETEEARATLMLEMASNRLLLIGEQVSVDVQSKVDTSAPYASVAQWVVMEATKRAMNTPIDQPPVDEFSQTAGPYSENYKYTNPSGDLWFKKSELASLGLYGNQRLGSINTTHRDMYEEWPSS